MADPYSILGVSRQADDKAIKSAYRKLAKELHPDRNQDNPRAAERFAEVTQAYDVLSDAQKRGQYDRGEIDENGQPRSPFGGGFGGGGPFGAGGARPGQGGFEFGGGIDLGDMFAGLFGGGAGARPGGPGRGPQPGPPPNGANIAYEHLVSFTDAAKQEPQRITLRDGKTVEFKLPPGMVAGQQIRIPGKGQPGPGGNGDAMVTLKIGKHPFFERDGDNVRLDLPVSLKEAISGAKVKVPTLDGAVMLDQLQMAVHFVGLGQVALGTAQFGEALHLFRDVGGTGQHALIAGQLAFGARAHHVLERLVSQRRANGGE